MQCGCAEAYVEVGNSVSTLQSTEKSFSNY